MAKTTAAATAAAARAAVPIAAVRLLNRPGLPSAAPGRVDGVMPGGGVPGDGAGSRSSEPFDRGASPAGRGPLGPGPVFCQVFARMVWVGDSWTRGDGA